MDIFTLHKSRDLIYNLVIRDIKVRYKSSILGILWSLLKPLFLMVILSVVFSQLVGFSDLPYPYPLHVLTGILSWMFLSGAIGESVYSIIGHGNLIKKVKINASAFPVSTVMANFVHFAIAMIVMFLFLAFYRQSIGPVILLLPFVMILQFLLAVGLALIVSSLYVFYRDVGSIVEVMLMGWFYLTPIIYHTGIVERKAAKYGAWLYKIYLLNPQTVILTFFRNTLLTSTGGFFSGFGDDNMQGFYYLIYIVVVLIVLLLVGNFVFRHYRDKFVDEL